MHSCQSANKGDSYTKFTFFYEREEDNKDVNIFYKHSHYVTTLLSILCKTYCCAFQKRLFCTVKA